MPAQSGSPVALGNTSTHDGFPGVCRLASGSQDLLCVYRQATDHGTTFDGILRKRTSTDNGATWSDPPVTIWNPSPDSAGGCCLTRLANDDIIITTWLKLNGVDDHTPYSILSTDDGATWGTPVVITSSFTDWAMCEAPVQQTANGDLYTVLYGADTGDTYTSARMSKSTDGGASWVDAGLIADGDAIGRHMQEPQLLILNNGVWLCMIRTETAVANVAEEPRYSLSFDQGASWSTPKGGFAGDGRPNIFQRSNGLIVCAYRVAGTNAPRFRVSNDGIRWVAQAAGTSQPFGDFSSGSTLYYAYGQWVELSTGDLGIAYSLQSSNTDADVWFSKIA